MKIALIIGHDYLKRGASKNDTKLGTITEFSFNDEFINGLNLCYDDNIYGVFYRNADINGYSNQMDELHERLKKFSCDFAIEFHINDFEDKSVDGYEVLAMSNSSMMYAEKLNSKYSKYLSSNNRGAKKITSSENGYGFLSRGSYPCIIAEPFFMNSVDKYLIREKERLNLILATIEFLGELNEK